MKQVIKINVNDIAKSIETELIDIRRDFHMNPEISYEEVRTTERIKEILESLNIKIVDIGLETGVVGLLETGKPGPTIAIRGDIDALPIQEANEVSYKSRVKGVSHACGHDIHLTSVIGAAIILSKMKDKLCGNVKFLFQPLEERNQGAKKMIELGALENPKVDAIFGLHNQPDIPAGKIGLKFDTALMAAVDRIEIIVEGVSAHGSLPHRSIDTITIASYIVTALQTIVSRNVNPQEAAVVSICKFNAGNTYNVIADRAELLGTVRSFNPELREAMPQIIEKLVFNVAESMGAKAHVNYYRECPLVISTGKYADIAKSAASKICGPDGVIDPTPSTGGEDFAWFLEKVPGCFFWLGVGNKDKGIIHPWHSTKFDADESSLAVGSAVLAQCVIDSIN